MLRNSAIRRGLAWAAIGLILTGGMGCNRSARREIQSAAYSTFQSGVDALFGQLTNELDACLTSFINQQDDTVCGQATPGASQSGGGTAGTDGAAADPAARRL